MTTADLNEWSLLRQQKKAADTAAEKAYGDHWKEQEAVTKRIKELRSQIILGHDLIPKDGWRLEMDHNRSRIVIRHEQFRDDGEVWKDLFEMVWPDADYHDSIYLVGRPDYPDEPSIVLRTDDDEMRMQFSPPDRLPAFIKSYGLGIVDGGAFAKQREELVAALAGLDETLALLKTEAT